MWAGLFRTDRPVPEVEGVRPLLGRRCVLVALVRYLEGTLRYDELLVGPLVRRGLRVGVFCGSIWVNDAASLWGGRRIWGIPKQMARFDWENDTVCISDDAGPIASLVIDRHDAWLPSLWLSAPGFGQLDGQWTHVVAHVRARIGRCGMRINDWSTRFGYRPRPKPLVGFAGKPFQITVPSPCVLGPAPGNGSTAQS
jgi:hypothetical protein